MTHSPEVVAMFVEAIRKWPTFGTHQGNAVRLLDAIAAAGCVVVPNPTQEVMDHLRWAVPAAEQEWTLSSEPQPPAGDWLDLLVAARPGAQT